VQAKKIKKKKWRFWSWRRKRGKEVPEKKLADNQISILHL